MFGVRDVIWLAIAAALALGPVAPAGAQSELAPEAAAERIAERYGVEVLRVEAAEDAGRPVYIVTVMNPGGDYNGAFQVNRLMIDRTTGELVSQFQHGATGYALPPGSGDVTGGASGEAIRRMSLPQGGG